VGAGRLPLVGLTTYVEDVTWGVRSSRSALTPEPYYELVASAGAQPVLLPSAADLVGGPGAGAASLIGALDALVIIGGLDVDPSFYGAAPGAHLGRTDPVRDRSELALAEAALATDLPMLCICRGHQILNVALGGTLLQHVPDLVGHVGHQPGDGQYELRPVECDPASLVEGVFGSQPQVQCSHHQAIDRLGDGLVATAWSVEEPGVPRLIEAVARTGSRFLLSVQWHPEKAGDQRPFEALVQAC
jgi:putative glutamine amidotransferase